MKIHDQDVIRVQTEDTVIDDTEEVFIRHTGADRLFTIEEGPDLIIAEVGGREHQGTGVDIIHEHHFLFLRNRVERGILARELHGHIAGRAVTDLNCLHFRILEDTGKLLNRLAYTEVAEKLVGMGRHFIGIAAAGDKNGIILQRDRVNTAAGDLLQQLEEPQQRRVFSLKPAQRLTDRRFRRIDELSDTSQLSAARHAEILPEPEINAIGRERRIAAHVHFRINQIAVERPGPHRQQLVHADNRLRERLIGSSRFNLLRTGKGNIKSGNHGFKKTSVQVSTENERNLSLVYG
ncbi:unknown [Sutterella sp. CAG:351]|nr:unknown [Sutterella sp. CAG:351]